MFNEGNQIHNFISSSCSGTVINYGYGSNFLASYGSSSTSQKVTVLVPVPRRWCNQPEKATIICVPNNCFLFFKSWFVYVHFSLFLYPIFWVVYCIHTWKSLQWFASQLQYSDLPAGCPRAQGVLRIYLHKRCILAWNQLQYLPLSQISCAHFSNNCRRARGTPLTEFAILHCKVGAVFAHSERWTISSCQFSLFSLALLFITVEAAFRRISFSLQCCGSGPHWLLSPWSGSGTRGAKMLKWRKFMFWFEVLYIFLWGLRGFSLELGRPSWRSTEK